MLGSWFREKPVFWESEAPAELGMAAVRQEPHPPE